MALGDTFWNFFLNYYIYFYLQCTSSFYYTHYKHIEHKNKVLKNKFWNSNLEYRSVVSQDETIYFKILYIFRKYSWGSTSAKYIEKLFHTTEWSRVRNVVSYNTISFFSLKFFLLFSVIIFLTCSVKGLSNQLILLMWLIQWRWNYSMERVDKLMKLLGLVAIKINM